MAHNGALFDVGEVVQRANQPEAIGIVREIRWDEQVESWNYLVQFGAQLHALPQEALQRVKLFQTPWDALSQHTLSGANHFIFTLTYHRLRHPPARIAHSFATTRTQFYPHQFKPLLKFLDHPGKRLLLADDVGLGKTIEAGYVLRELEAHQVVERVLILVPARLAPKWKREMVIRFEEHFEVVKGGEIIHQADSLRRGREMEPFRWIVSYESVRPEEVRHAIEETQLPIDVLIADEAHRMRNPETLQHKVGSVLCRCADTVMFLSATPVQNKLEDLWHLLRLLSPQEFSEWRVFEEAMNANRFLLMAQHSLSKVPPDLEEAGNRIITFAQLRGDSSGRHEEFLNSVIERTKSVALDRRDLVELQADIAHLSPVGHAICRTRKAEAMVRRPQRAANWVPVRLSDAEREIYDSVEALCRMVWPGVSDSWGFQMSLLMAYRITASCIPAAMRYFSEKLSGTLTTPFSDELEEKENDDERVVDPTAWTGPTRERLKDIVELYGRLPSTDSKLEELIKALKTIWDEDKRASRSQRKVVLFSFFRRTLEYLASALSSRSVGNRMIHGGISVDDREYAIDEFLESPDVAVLLTSEVGGEGIDLQKAAVVINYDLPWNPMVVEQRIGRVDRIGQEADRIVVLNLVVKDSIEERVLGRLLDKIEVFRGSIGELDHIIGDEIERITAQALRGELSEDELQKVVQERGDALAHRLLEAKEMLSRVDGLLAADQGLIDEINGIIGERQIPSERELFLFLNFFLAKRFPGCQLPREVMQEVVNVDLRGQLASSLEICAGELGSDALLFARRISTGPVPFTLSREAGYHHPRAEVAHLHHPLVRYAVREILSSDEQRHAAFAVSIPEGKLPIGSYGFLIAMVHVKSHRPVAKLVAAIASVAGDRLLVEPEETTPIIIEMLEKGRDVETRPLEADEYNKLKGKLLSALEGLKAEWDARERRLDRARGEQQHTALRVTFDFRVRQASERVETLIRSSADQFAIRMGRARLEKVQRERDAFISTAIPSTWGGIEHEELAVGLLQIGGEH
jgi:hypothetical protein